MLCCGHPSAGALFYWVHVRCEPLFSSKKLQEAMPLLLGDGMLLRFIEPQSVSLGSPGQKLSGQGWGQVFYPFELLKVLR